MKQVFLEAHNIKNKYSGFGQFNYHLIKALATVETPGFKMVLNVKDVANLKLEFGNTFKYRRYQSITRHKPFRIKKKYALWHCLNQNIKIEPFFNIPYLLTVHDIHFVSEGPEGIRKKLRAHFEKKLKRANAIVYISEFAKKDTHNHFNVPNIPEYVVHNGNTITEITLAKNYQPEELPKQKYLFSIGAFTARKNFKCLVAMLRFLPEYDLVLAGNSDTFYAKEIIEDATRYGLKNRIYLIGKIDEDAKQYYLSNCEAFVFPSLREGFGIPPIEAMRFGKPVFISNNTSLPEVGGEHSFYWDHYEPQYMAGIVQNGLEKFKANPAFYTSWYIERAKSFSWENTAQEYAKIYKSLL